MLMRSSGAVQAFASKSIQTCAAIGLSTVFRQIAERLLRDYAQSDSRSRRSNVAFATVLRDFAQRFSCDYAQSELRSRTGTNRRDPSPLAISRLIRQYAVGKARQTNFCSISIITHVSS
jgi:hypothetical protein